MRENEPYIKRLRPRSDTSEGKTTSGDTFNLAIYNGVYANQGFDEVTPEGEYLGGFEADVFSWGRGSILKIKNGRAYVNNPAINPGANSFNPLIVTVVTALVITRRD